ncbi:MAG: lamin tail domain-containing protein [Bacteroidales bacterium]|nr:lamin tail domain-containing protein [Bacteroidales bacterium]
MKRKAVFYLLAMVCASTGALAQGTLCVSELLFQPRSGEAEYVELYNGGSAPVELSNYHIVRWIGDSLGTHYPLPSHTVAPHDYVVLTKDAASVTENYNVKVPSKLVECNLPTYPNDGGSVVLARADGTVVEKFDYLPSMHSRLLRNKAGVALERRSLEQPCNEADNWFSASSTAGYGTPGYENSQSQEYLVEETAFDFSSTLVSPDGDGYQDEIIIDYLLEDNEIYANVIFFDARGKLVRRLLNNALLGTHGSIVWDGRGENGQTLAKGRYVLYINLHDLHGTQQSIKRAVTVVR